MTKLIHTLTQQLQAAPDDRSFIDLLNLLSYHQLVRDAKVASIFAEQAESLATEANYARGIADSKRNQAFGLYYNGRYQQAIAIGAALITQYIRLEDYGGLAQAHSIIGLCEAALSDYGGALEYHLKALEFARHLNNNDTIAECYNNIAQVYAETDKVDAALEHYQQAITLRQQSENRLGLADVYNNLAKLLTRIQRYDDALDYAQRAVSICEAHDYDAGLARTYNTLGHIYTNWGRYALAQEYLIQSKDTANHNDWIAIELTALHQLAKLHIRMDDMLGALDYLGQAQKRAEMLEQIFMQAEIHRDLSAVFKRMDDPELALTHFETYHDLYRQRFAEERDAKLRALEIAHKTKTARTEAQFQRQRAEELEQRRDADRQYFESLNKMKDEFLNSTTHDLKNPLATIKTNIYLLRKTVQHPKAPTFIDRIEWQVERMHGLINDMLDLAKLETGRALERVEAAMSDLLIEVLNEYQAQADERSMTLEFYDDAASTHLQFDPKLMQRVLSNLISNAIKYTDDGGTVSVAVQDDAQTLIIDIMDTGVGIPAESLPHIFDNFYRVDEDQSRSVEGTGLGLAIVKKIVEQHAGTITVKSRFGEGTTFRIQLPK